MEPESDPATAPGAPDAQPGPDEEPADPPPPVRSEDLLTDAAVRPEDAVDAELRPDDPIEGEAARRGADPDLAPDTGRGEEP